MQAYNYVKNLVNAAGGKEQFKTITQQFINYGTNLQNAIQGKELFTAGSTATTPDASLQVNPVPIGTMNALFIVYIIIMVLLTVIYGYGAARLSYCYNIAQGATSGTAIFWAVLCFLFSGWYYPFHGIFLSSCGSVVTNTMRKVGGGRR